MTKPHLHQTLKKTINMTYIIIMLGVVFHRKTSKRVNFDSLF
jgi:hypothetical protein